MDQPDAKGLVGIDSPCSHDKVLGPGWTDKGSQSWGATPSIENAHIGLRDPEEGLFRGDPEVTGHADRETRSKGKPVYGSDRDLLEVLHGPHEIVA